MKRNIIYGLTIAMSIGVFILISCSSGNNDSKLPSNSSGGLPNDNNPWKINLSYEYNGFSISKEVVDCTFKDAKSDKSDLESRYVYLPSDYLIKDFIFNGRNFDDCTDSWTVDLVAKYEGYMAIESDKPYLNNQILPTSILSKHMYKDVFTVNNYDGVLISFYMKDIVGIKFKNSKEAAFPVYNDHAILWEDYTELSNLTKIDVTELEYVKTIGNNYFSYFKDLTSIEIGDGFKNVEQIGSDFLAYTRIKGGIFNFANVKTVGNRFLYNGLTRLDSSATVKFNQLSQSGLRTLTQSSMNSGTKLIIELNNVIPDSNWFTMYGLFDLPDFVSYERFGSGNSTPTYDIKTNYADNLEVIVSNLLDDGSTFYINNKSIHEHKYNSDVWDYNETYHWHECLAKDEVSSKSVHDFGEWIIDIAPTECEGGKRHKDCRICGYTIIEKMDHIHTAGKTEEDNRVEPTCILDGSYDKVVFCSECGEEISRETIILPALEHVMVHHQEFEKEQTCTGEGYSDYYMCSRCGFVTKNVVPPKGHLHLEEKEENRTEPTCDSDGSYDLVTYCEDDNYEIKREKIVIPKLNHDYKIVSVVEPSYEEDGVVTYKCSRCGDEYCEKGNEKLVLSVLSFEINPDASSYSVKAKNKDIDGTIVIPSLFEGLPVTSIIPYGFEGCSNITSINLPSSVHTIGQGALANCKSLTSFVIPENVTSISSSLFENCSSLLSIVIHQNVTSIGSDAFSGCVSLQSITIPCNITSIEDGVFRSCSSLTTISIPEKVTSIGYDAFGGCISLKSVVIPESVTSIENHAFSSCSNLTSINIPNSVTKIGDGVFSFSDKLSSSKYENGLYLGNSENPYVLFLKPINENVSSINIHDNCKFINYRAFWNNNAIQTVIIPNGIISIGANNFSCCSSLQCTNYENGKYLGNSENPYLVLVAVIDESVDFVEINNDCKIIMDYVFNNCNSLTKLIVPRSVLTLSNIDGIDLKRIESIYYCGDYNVSLLSENMNGYHDYIEESMYYYSEVEPTDFEHKYWHYVGDDILVW